MYSLLRIIFLLVLMWQTVAKAVECPPSDSLYKEIVSIATNNFLSDGERLKRLLSFKDQTDNCPSRTDSVYAYLLRRIGVAYAQSGEYNKAVDFTRQAIAVIRSNWGKPSVNLSHLPNCYYNLQSYYDSTHQELLKRQAIDSCIATDLRIGGNYFYSSYLISDKIELLQRQGDYIRALEYATLVENLFHNSDSNQLKARCVAIIYHANILIILKRYQEALHLLKTEMPTFEARNEYIGSVYTLVGIINIYIGSFNESLATFFRSIQFHKKIHHRSGIAEAYHWVGFIYSQKLNRHKTALTYFRAGLKYADAVDAVPILSDIGKAYVTLREFDSAFHCFQLAFDMIRPGCNETTIIRDALLKEADEPTLNYVTTLLINKGNAYLRFHQLKGDKNSLENALNIYKMADRFLANLQSFHLELGSKLFWRDNTRELYENAIEAGYLLHNAETAFYFFERSRAAILNAQLTEQRWIPEMDMIKLAELKKEIYLQERALKDESNPTANHLQLERNILQNKERLGRMQGEIRTRYPLYYQRYIDTSINTIQEVRQKLLQHHQAVVELFEGDSAVYVLVIKNEKIDLQKIEKALFEELSKRFISFISEYEQLNARYPEFINTAHQLYKLIFASGTLPDGRIIFSPDGKYFPFEALVSNAEPVEYFVQAHAVSYTYSVRYLLQDRAEEINKTRKNFFGIAPIRFNPGWQLSSLSGSDESLRRIHKNFANSQSLVAESATRANFLGQFDQYRIIQLYTHATDSGSSGEPMIYFSDSTLSLSELIYGRKPTTRLVVLSACQTGLGKLYNGEGVFNFNRGFAAMGIPSSVSNLWQIEMQATYALTELFYRQLSTGLPADVALQQAKIAFMKEGDSRRNQLPYLWAASILVGDSDIYMPEKTFPWQWLLLLPPLVIVFAWWQIKRVGQQK